MGVMRLARFWVGVVLMVLAVVTLTSVRPARAFSGQIRPGPDPQFINHEGERAPKDWNPSFGSWGGPMPKRCKAGVYASRCGDEWTFPPVIIDAKETKK